MSGDIKRPYLIFIGDAEDEVVAKTGLGILQWRRDDCLAKTAGVGGALARQGFEWPQRSSTASCCRKP